MDESVPSYHQLGCACFCGDEVPMSCAAVVEFVVKRITQLRVSVPHVNDEKNNSSIELRSIQCLYSFNVR